MINYEGVVKLTDFGIAKAAHIMEQKEGSLLVGKASYMSPEQARRETTDHRSDLFSLGAVMYELLTGVSVFRGEDVEETLNNVIRCRIPDPRDFEPKIPPRLVTIVGKALERDRSRRFASAAEMGYELERFMYHNRFGPTNVTLGRYVRRLMLGIDVKPGETDGQPARSGLATIDPQGDTISLPVEPRRERWWRRFLGGLGPTAR